MFLNALTDLYSAEDHEKVGGGLHPAPLYSHGYPEKVGRSLTPTLLCEPRPRTVWSLSPGKLRSWDGHQV